MNLGDAPMTGRSKDVDALVLPGAKWTPHDLRRTAATTMAELGALPDVVEKCLNHTQVGKVERIYQRAPYEGPRREAWKLLGSRLALLQDMAHGRVTNVTPLPRSRQPPSRQLTPGYSQTFERRKSAPLSEVIRFILYLSIYLPDTR